MELYRATEAMAALAHETRLEIFRLLIQHGPNGLVVAKIADHIAIPPATLSFHLSNLQRAGLLTSKRDGRQITYSANFEHMSSLISFLTENCCQAAANNVENKACLPDAPSC